MHDLNCHRLWQAPQERIGGIILSADLCIGIAIVASCIILHGDYFFGIRDGILVNPFRLFHRRKFCLIHAGISQVNSCKRDGAPQMPSIRQTSLMKLK